MNQIIFGGIELADELAHRRWLKAVNSRGKGYKPKVVRKTLLDALSEARVGMSRSERREHLINTIVRGLR